MPVKPAENETVEQTIRTRVLKNKPEEEERIRLLPLWDYVETVPLGEWGSGEYEFTIYRGTKAQKADDKTWIGKFREKMTPDVIQSRWGGGDYNIWFKCPPGFQLRYNIDLKIEGAPRTNGNGNYSSTPVAGDPISQIVAMFREELRAMREEMKQSRGGDLGMEAVKQAISLNGQVFSSGAESLRTTLGGVGAPTVPVRDPLMDRLLTAAVDRLFAAPQPATNSVKDVLEMVSALKGAGIFGGSAEKTGLALELVRQVPTIANSLVHGMEAWRFAEEARARNAAITRGAGAAQPPINVQPIPPQPAERSPGFDANAGGAPAAQTQMPADKIPGIEVQPMPLETLEQMVATIVADESLSVEDAATEACALIERTAPGQTDQMAKQGEDWLFNLFQIRPVLAQVGNHPRLREFIKKFIETVKSAPVNQPINPNAPVA